MIQVGYIKDIKDIKDIRDLKTEGSYVPSVLYVLYVPYPNLPYRTVAVTLAVPTFELESAQRKAIRCSPGLSNFALTLKLS